MMLFHLIRKELLDHLLSVRFLILAVTGVLSIALSFYAGYAYYHAVLKDYRLAKAVTEDEVRGIQERRNWSEIMSVGFLEHKPPSPMTIFVRGQDPNLPRTLLIASPLRVRRMIRSPEGTEPLLGVFRSLDLGKMVQVVLGLFVLLFTFDTICGEKEGGTLRLTGSYPVPRHLLILGKWIGALIPILAAFGLPMLLGTAIVLLLPDVNFSREELVRVLFILVLFCLYLAVFASIGVLGSCLTHRPATSFVILLAFWVGAAIVLPRLSLIVSDGIHPLPSAANLQAEKKEFENVEVQKWWELILDWREKQSESGGQWSPETREAYLLYYDRTVQEARRIIESYWDRLDEAYRNRYNTRLDLAVALARVSPVFALHHASIRIAGTGLEPHRKVQDAFERYTRDYHRWRGSKRTRVRLQEAFPDKYQGVQRNWSDMPRFSYREAPDGKELDAALIDIGILCFWSLCAFCAAFVALLRYDFR